MSFEDYQRLTKQRRNIADALAMPGIADIAFEPPRATIKPRPVDFSWCLFSTPTWCPNCAR
jgi:hypothetical protein